MCGITGFVGEPPAGGARPVLEQMLARIAHRGPDGQGLWTGGPAALGHCRLAIVDAAGGAQPFWNEDHTVAVVFNGEIYNHAALRAELEAAGHRFASRCDTEVLVHGYEAWGSALPAKLRGMFAFAVWDCAAGTLFCARDPFGVKPFYYYQGGGAFLFGSEIKCFLPHPAFAKALNTAQLEPYLSFQYSPGDDTFFAGVKKLPPAHWLRWHAGRLTLGRYWQPALCPAPEGDAGWWARRIHAALTESVQAHLQADVPVGCFLSSGVDSLYLAALAGPRAAFSVGFSDRRYSELDKVTAAARQLRLPLRGRCIAPEEYWAALGGIQYAMDEPLADASAPALYFLARTAAQSVKVCLSGEGADELFGGYNVYADALARHPYDRLPAPVRRAAGAAAGRLPPVRGVNFLERHSQPPAQRYIGPSEPFTPRRARRLLRPGLGGTPAQAFAAPCRADAAGLDPAAQLQSCDLRLWLVGDILLKADKMSMAHGLEVRVPYLDREVFAAAAAVPAALRADSGATKLALRQAAQTVLPPALAQRRKLGFPVPVRAWLRDPQFLAQVEQAFHSEAAREFFRPKALEQLLAWHRSGRCDVWRQLWCVYMFLLWYREYFILR